jgi:striatin 1/3/4
VFLIAKKSPNAFLDAELDNDPTHPDFRQDAEREKSRVYLSKCAQEVSYHVIPVSHPPLELSGQDLQGNLYGEQQLPQQSLEEAYHQQRQKQQQQQQQQNNMMVREGVMQNHQSIPANYVESNRTNIPNEQPDRRNSTPQTPLSAIDSRDFASEDIMNHKDRADEPGLSLSRLGLASNSGEGARQQQAQDGPADTGGWNFEEPVEALDVQTENVPHHRPDTDAFPKANFVPTKSPPRGSHRRKSSGSTRRKSEGTIETREAGLLQQNVDSTFKVRFALRGHLDVVRSVIFTGGGSPSEPEICTGSDDGTIKRWILPASYGSFGPGAGNDLDITSYFTHRGHVGAVTSLAACPASPTFSNGGRALGDGWVFSGGQDASIRVWERGRVDPKATLDGHTDAVWGLCILPGTAGSVFGDLSSNYGGPDRILLASGGADGRIIIWAVSAPPQVTSPQTGGRRGAGGRRANSISSGSNFPSSPQPHTATSTVFHHTIVHHIVRTESPSPTCISPLSLAGVNFVVSYADASILIYDTRTGEEVVGMASLETYDGTPSTGVNSVVTSTIGFDGTASLDPNRALTEEEAIVHGATGTSGGVEGVIISGYEDRYIRFFDANSGK